MRIHCIILAFALAAGCSSSPPPCPAPTAAQLAQWEREENNAKRALAMLESGQIHSGQSIAELLELCTPYSIHFVDKYAFIEFHAVPNLTGLSLVAIDGKLAHATQWNCVNRHDFFNTLSESECAAATDAYERRLFDGR